MFFFIIFIKELIMFKDFGNDIDTAIEWAKYVRELTKDVSAAEAYRDTYQGKTRIKVRVLRKYDAIAAEAWDAYLRIMITGVAEKNTPVVKVA